MHRGCFRHTVEDRNNRNGNGNRALTAWRISAHVPKVTFGSTCPWPDVHERADVVSYPIYNLELAEWNRKSIWGWDPAQETLYAQLTRNGSNIEADVQGRR